jgi:signal peptidase I
LAHRHRFLRALYWVAWFFVLPLALSYALVWALSPPAGTDHGSILATVESYAREQQIPVGIVIFTMFEMALWAARHYLPLARFVHAPLRADIPARCLPTYERASVLVEEAEILLERHQKAIVRELSSKDREALQHDLSELREAMQRSPFDEELFNEAWIRADGQVDTRLRPWRKSEVREYLESILVAVMVALGLRAIVVEAFKIPSGSMIPTLQVGDHIFVNKFIYGPAIPFTHSRFWTSMPPARGDVIVHAYPENMEQDFIKRVIAVPGDVLEAKNGHPWINGWEVPHCFVGIYSYNESSAESEMPSSFQRHEGDLFVEYLGDKTYLTLYDHATGGYSDHQGPFRARPGEVWVMGDNRNNSHDSRMWWNYKGGGVPFENIRGRAVIVWLSTFDGKSDWARLGTNVMGRPRLPADMANLEPAMEKCFRERPPVSKTTPPPPPPETSPPVSGPDTDERKLPQ